MSLNTIPLPSRMVADFYRSSLIEAVSSNPPKNIKFLGTNRKNILILVSKENFAFIEEEELSFLSAILTACKLSVADVAIVNLKTTGIDDYRFFLRELNSKIVLLFDVDSHSIDLPFNFPHFQIQQFDQCTYLAAPALNTIEKEKSLKAQLWNCLKNIFFV